MDDEKSPLPPREACLPCSLLQPSRLVLGLTQLPVSALTPSPHPASTHPLGEGFPSAPTPARVTRLNLNQCCHSHLSPCWLPIAPRDQPSLLDVALGL